MQITFIDDSLHFDGGTPGERPLGSAEKSLVGLADALATCGHDVVVINRCLETREIRGVTWLPWDAPRPPSQDVAVAFRKAGLLGEIEQADHMGLWMWGGCKPLNKPANQALLDKYRPTLVYVSEAQRRGWKPWREFKEVVVTPAVGQAYLGASDLGAEPSAIALTTTHPAHGLREIVRLWEEGIHPLHPDAQLHVYSAALARAKETGEVDVKLAAAFEDICNAERAGVLVKKPLPDPEMAAVYANAKVHLYPVFQGEMYCGTLAESQASGVPAVVNATDGNAGTAGERVRNGQTGYLAPDESAFVNLTGEILAEDSGMYRTLHRDALTLQRQRSWQAAAIEFEALWR